MDAAYREIANRILGGDGQELNPGQERALQLFGEFLEKKPLRGVFILTGAAGTGKTFLVRVIAGILAAKGRKSVLLAPTGRSAKVVSRRAKKNAFTIHRYIYSPKESVSGAISFSLKNNTDAAGVCYIVDEASMVGDAQSGRSLLRDLLEFAWSNDPEKPVIMVGDPYQLPPVGSSISPALDPDYLKAKYMASASGFELKEILRQQLDSGILEWAIVLRNSLTDGTIPVLESTRGKDVQILEGIHEGIEIVSPYFNSGNKEQAVILTYSNRAASQINRGIRHLVFETEEEIVPGELLMVVKNNYALGDKQFPFIANGEMGIVREANLNTMEERYGLKWMDVVLEFRDLKENPVLVDCKIILSLLQDHAAQVSPDLLKLTAENRWAEYSDMTRAEKLLAFRNDRFINALQVKYAYAITVHKAQGGQWEKVVVAFEPQYSGIEIKDYIRWTYTAISRAEKSLYVVNCPLLKSEFN